MPGRNIIKKSVLTPTILVAGGAGFLGSHLVETLLQKECRIIVLDNFKTGKHSYVDNLISNPKFALYDVDINAGIPPEIESVDYIFQLAGLEEPRSEVSLDSLLTNAVGTKNLLDLAQRSSAKFVLASSIYVYQGMMSQLNISQYFGKTAFEEGKYSLNEAKRYAEALVWEYHKKNDTDVRVVRLPEIYGPRMDIDAGGVLVNLIKDLKENRDLTIFGEGSEKEYYLYVNDAVSGLVKSVFNDRTKGKIYSLIGSDPYSPLEIAFLLKSLGNRELKVEFKSKEITIEPKRVLPDTANLRDLSWEAKTSFKDGLIKSLNWLGYEVNSYSFKHTKIIEEKKKENGSESLETLAGLKEESAPTPVTVAPVNTSPYKILNTSYSAESSEKRMKFKSSVPHLPSGGGFHAFLVSLLLLAFLVMLFVGVPSIQTYRNAKSAVAELRQIPTLLGQFNPDRAVAVTNSSFQHFYKAQQSFGRLRWLFSLVGKKDLYDSLSQILASASYSSRSAYFFSKASMPVSTLWETIRPDSEKLFEMEAFEKSKSDFALAQNNLQLAQAEMKNVNASLFEEEYRGPVAEYSTMLATASSKMDFVSAAYLGLSDIIGVASSKKYLILFQNSNEIRPTGGFIGSYAVLELDKGKITNLTIDDIYNPDGQIDLRGIKVSSPKPIKDLLNEPDLHLRNANWNPDFPKSAMEIQDLYYKVTGEKTDGVIAIDLDMAKNLLDVTGPIFLTAYNEEISADNLYERTQYHSEFNYKDGSDQKRSFLTVLGSKLLEKVFALPKEKLPVLWTSMHEALQGRHLMIYLNNNPFGAYLEKEGWDGSLVKTDGDYLYVVNANLGGTKANYYVKNDMKYEILSSTRDGLLRGQVSLTYTHTGESDAWPGGPYKDYVRVLTQKGSKLTGAKIQYGSKGETDIFKDMVIDKIGNYNSFETSFTLNPKETLTVTFLYDLPENLSVTKDMTEYDFYWQKQPGTVGDSVSFVFNAPFGLRAVPSSFEGTFDEDKRIHLSLDPQ